MRSYLELIAECLELRVDDILSTSRRRPLVDARACYAYLAWQKGSMLVDIGFDLGRNHSTITHYLNEVIPLPEVQDKLHRIIDYMGGDDDSDYNRLTAHIWKRSEQRKKFAEVFNNLFVV